MYVNDYWSKLGAAPSERESYRVPTPVRAVPAPTVKIIPPPISPVMRTGLVSRRVTPVIRRTVVQSKTAVTPLVKALPYIVERKMAPRPPVEVSPRPSTLPLVIKSTISRTVSDYYRKPVSQPVTKDLATLTTTSSGKAAIEFPAVKTTSSALVSQDKPFVELVDKNAPATEAGSMPTNQEWIRYGMIAVGVFILMKTFSGGRSPRLKRMH